MHEQPLRLFHELILSHRLPEEQEKVEKYEGRQEKKGLEFERIGKGEKSEEKDRSTCGHPEHQSALRVSLERIPIIAGTFFQKTEF